MKSTTRSACLLLLPALLLSVSGCSGSSSPSPTVITVPAADLEPPPAGPLLEIEPNDDAWNADYIGEILPGDYLAIEGHVTECCPDPFDGFAFYALEPVEVVITLTELDYGTDLDFGLYEPFLDEVIAAWETDAHPEVGTFYFDGVGEFHIVVASYFGDSSYLLELEVFELDPVMTLLASAESGGSTPEEPAHQRFQAYHAAPELDSAPSRALAGENDRAMLLPVLLPTPDLLPPR